VRHAQGTWVMAPQCKRPVGGFGCRYGDNMNFDLGDTRYENFADSGKCAVQM